MFPQDFEYQATQVLPSMIESKLTLFKMQVKNAGGHSTEVLVRAGRFYDQEL